jgi:hypothetical protein
MIMVLLDNVQIVASNKRTFSIGKCAFNSLFFNEIEQKKKPPVFLNFTTTE